MKKIIEKLTSLKAYSLPFKLQKRERIIVTVGTVALGILIILQFMIFPIIDHRALMRKAIVAKTLNLQEMKALRAEVDAVSLNTQNTQQQLKRRPSGFTLFSFLDKLAGSTGIKQNITYMKPSNTNLKNSPYVLSMVEMKLQSLTMEQLIKFLHGVENASEQIWVKRMSITKGEKDEGLLTSVLQVETYQL